MKTLYISCEMGAAGDMLTAALLELFPDPQAIVGQLNHLGIPGVRFETETVFKCGIKGTHMHVYVEGEEESDHLHDHTENHQHDHHQHDHHHHHSSLTSIRHIVQDHLQVDDKVREDILQVYQRLAEAESQIHGTDVSEIHFHEVGTMDAVADITAVCYLLHLLAPDEILASPVHTGQGTVHCAHGILPVPAPATALLLEGIPIYSKASIQGELCTPTGAALLRHFVHSFREMPPITVDRIGYGMGKKDFPQANCIRVFYGESMYQGQQILELSCNLDDMTGEEVGYASQLLMESGALDVFTVPIGMKKGRPGILFHVLCRENDRDTIVKLLFQHTSTLGIRESVKNRYVLERQVETMQTSLGDVRIKRASGFGIKREKYEYDDIAAIAKENGYSILEVISILDKERREPHA